MKVSSDTVDLPGTNLINPKSVWTNVEWDMWSTGPLTKKDDIISGQIETMNDKQK